MGTENLQNVNKLKKKTKDTGKTLNGLNSIELIDEKPVTRLSITSRSCARRNCDGTTITLAESAAYPGRIGEVGGGGITYNSTLLRHFEFIINY